eukprot:747588-Hanusia_phi.AAC.2
MLKGAQNLSGRGVRAKAAAAAAAAEHGQEHWHLTRCRHVGEMQERLRVPPRTTARRFESRAASEGGT